ncbi:MAG: hypothetical protein ACRDTJ_05490 [Pseudonocardiaceae bacterium]
MPGPSAGARPHTAACGKCLRDRMLGAAGSPDPVPDELIAAITEQIAAHCGHIRLKCHRLALGWTVGQAVAAVHAYCRDKGLHEVGLTDRSWKDWESGRAPSPD